MSTNFLGGVHIKSFEDPIRQALAGYTDFTRGHVEFDIDAATQLKETPDKPYTGRSTADVTYLGKEAGRLVVVAFAPGDGTGDESSYPLERVATARYPHHAKVLPRAKHGVHAEAHLTLASSSVDAPGQDPVLYAGNLDIVGIDQAARQLYKLDNAGQIPLEFQPAMAHGGNRNPLATYTVGNERSSIGGGGRYGDPHAIYNPHPEYFQVAGFLAVSTNDAFFCAKMLEELNAKHTS